MKSLIYQFRRARLAGTLNLLGIALALAGTYVLLTQTIYSMRYNRCFPGYADIYRVEVRGMVTEGWSPHLSRPVAESLAELPVVEDLDFTWEGGTALFDKDGSDVPNDVVRCSGRLPALLGMQCVDGRLTLNEEDREHVVIPASLAVRYFGREDVAGESMRTKNGSRYTVAGVYRDLPPNCFAGNIVYRHCGDLCRKEPSEWSFKCYIRVKEGTPQNTVEKTLHEECIRMIEENMGTPLDKLTKEQRDMVEGMDFGAIPLHETYFCGHDPHCDRGNRRAIGMQALATLMLVVICMANFANFSMAQAPGRIRSLTIRKVMGGQTWRLRLGLMAEGVLTTAVAWLAAMAMIFVMSRQESVTSIFTADIRPEANPATALMLLPLATAIGLAATAYSSRYATSFPTVTAMRGNAGLSPRGTRMRQWLVGLQLCAAIVMILFLGIISAQSHYIYHSDYGFAKDSIMLFHLEEIPLDKKHAIRLELEKLPGVRAVSFTGDVPGTADAGMTWGRGNGEVIYRFRVLPVEWNFLQTYGIRILEGRDFREGEGDVYIFNKAMKDMHPEITIGRPLCDGDLEVVGICDNFRAGTTRIDNSTTPIAFVVLGPKHLPWTGERCTTACIRLADGAHIANTRRDVTRILKDFAQGGPLPDVRFLDDTLEQTYREENNFMHQMRISTLLMLLITLTGVFCLTMFETEYRRKEIAIRRIMGSTIWQALLLMASRYTLPLLLAFAMAAPAGYMLGRRWLESFAEHTPVYWWLFPLALLSVATVVCATVVVQCWRVVTANPVDSIRTE